MLAQQRFIKSPIAEMWTKKFQQRDKNFQNANVNIFDFFKIFRAWGGEPPRPPPAPQPRRSSKKVEEVKTDDDETLQYFAKLADEA